MPKPLAFLALGLALATVPAWAARSFTTDDAGTVAPNTFELETAGNYWQNAVAFSLGLKHGLTERMDIGLGLGGCLLPEHTHGFDAACLGLKFSLWPNVLAASFNGVFGDPVYNVNLIYSKALKDLTVNTNLGGSLVAASTDADLTYSLAGVSTRERWETGAEIGGTQHALEWWQIGVRFSLSDRWALDIGLGGDFRKEMNLNAATGLCCVFPLTKGN